ncbi:8192_t:CDS:2 [Gigaspora margarita]|uniref:8192_t:CDS:1 n=1 Tax=Gigaspora margarita TaxID=4874 RepID=A0ABN7U8B7_GIGMA|nr:8192_t:CDS:2 [Gigaspora margarita]
MSFEKHEKNKKLKRNAEYQSKCRDSTDSDDDFGESRRYIAQEKKNGEKVLILNPILLNMRNEPLKNISNLSRSTFEQSEAVRQSTILNIQRNHDLVRNKMQQKYRTKREN